eukprot:COSAG01_NODE_1308_length_10794_cov_4.318654_1_plen_89_part_00
MATRRLSTRPAMMILLALCPARSSALDNGVVRLQPFPNIVLPCYHKKTGSVFISHALCVSAGPDTCHGLQYLGRHATFASLCSICALP